MDKLFNKGNVVAIVLTVAAVLLAFVVMKAIDKGRDEKFFDK